MKDGSAGRPKKIQSALCMPRGSVSRRSCVEWDDRANSSAKSSVADTPIRSVPGRVVLSPGSIACKRNGKRAVKMVLNSGAVCVLPVFRDRCVSWAEWATRRRRDDRDASPARCPAPRTLARLLSSARGQADPETNRSSSRSPSGPCRNSSQLAGSSMNSRI